jgi:hypothetical protein
MSDVTNEIPIDWSSWSDDKKDQWLLLQKAAAIEDSEPAKFYCIKCTRPVKYIQVHINKEHYDPNDISFIVTTAQQKILQTQQSNQYSPIPTKGILWFYGDDPAKDKDWHVITIHGLQSVKPSGGVWMPQLRDIYRFKRKEYLETLSLLTGNIFRKFPPTIYAVDQSRDPTYTEILLKRLGKQRMMPVKFGNSGSTNTKLDLKLIGRGYIKTGYEFPDADLLLRKKLVTPEKADTIRNLKEEMMREMITSTASDRISFDHPPNKNNDSVHSWELSLKAVMEYQKNRLGDGFAEMFSSVHVKGYQTALDTKSKTELTRENITKRFNAKRFGSHTNINVEL